MYKLVSLEYFGKPVPIGLHAVQLPPTAPRHQRRKHRCALHEVDFLSRSSYELVPVYAG